MTFLTATQDALRELKVPVPTTIVANTNNQDAMLALRLANKEAKAIRHRYDWQELRKEHTFATVAADAQTSSLPADFLRFVNETMFNRTEKRPLYGPITPQDWAEYKSGQLVPADPAFMVRAGLINIAPTPVAGRTIAFEYITKYTVTATGSTTPTKEKFSADTDSWFLDEEILTLAIIWRWRKQKGMTYEDERLEYERMLADSFIANGGKPRIHMGDVVPGQFRRGKPAIRDYNTI